MYSPLKRSKTASIREDTSRAATMHSVYAISIYTEVLLICLVIFIALHLIEHTSVCVGHHFGTSSASSFLEDKLIFFLLLNQIRLDEVWIMKV